MSNKASVWTTAGEQNGPPRPATVQSDRTCFDHPFLVAVQSKFRRKYYHKAVFLVLGIIIIILLIAIIILAIKVHNTADVCETRECLRAASNILQSMDDTADPCDDFYQFTCGNWGDNHPRPDSLTSYDWFSEKQAKVTRKIRAYLQANETIEDPAAIVKAKTMYKACMDTEEMNKLGVKPVIKYLKQFKLPVVPSLFNKSEQNVKNESNEYAWIESLALIKATIGLDILLGFDIFPDPTNRSTNRIGVGTPESGNVLPFNDDDQRIHFNRAKRKAIMEEVSEDHEDTEEDKTPAITAYLSYIRKVVAVMIVSAEPQTTVDEIAETLTTAAVESVRITKFIYKLNEEAENMTKSNPNPFEDLMNVSVQELQNLTDQFITPKTVPIWEKYLQILYNTVSSDLPNFDLKSGLLLTSKADVKYLQQIAEFFMETPPAHIEFFIWWNVVEELVLHTTTDLRRLHNEYTTSIVNTEGSTSRSLYCTGGINTMMGMAVSYVLADRKFLTDTLPKVKAMLDNIRQAFDDLVEATTWMDGITKVQTLEKSANMRSFIGFPEWISNSTQLDLYYDGITVNANTHLDNMINVLRWQIFKKLKSLNEENGYTWATAPSNVNAFHTFQANTITVPIAILQFPFYNLGLEAMNYGAIGTILGHELTHGFDDSGRMFDKNGNMRQWWSNQTITEYVNRTSCFVKQYSNYFLSDIREYVNGDITLGENIADNGGFREAYYAYKILQRTNGPEKQLPGLERYTHEQLLFMSFGNLWCETYTPAASRYALEDSHCPGRVRLLGVLSNSPEFSEAFACKKGSRMNPDTDRCRIW